MQRIATLAAALAVVSLAPLASAQSLMADPVFSAEPGTFAMRGGDVFADSLLYDDGDETINSFLGFGDGTAFRAAVRFTAEGDFSLDAARVFFRTETLKPGDEEIALEIYDGSGDDPSTSVLLETLSTDEQSEAGQLFLFTLDTPIEFADGDDFFIVLSFPEGLNFPAGTDDAAVDNEQRSFFSGDGGATYTALGDILGDGGPDAFFIRALSTTGSTAADELPANVTSVSVFPNPAAHSAALAIELAEASAARVTLHDVLGREVALVHDGTMAAGRTSLGLDLASLSTGVYVARIELDGALVTRQVSVVR